MSDTAIWTVPLLFGLMITLFLGVALGAGRTISLFDFNNRDCTIACPGSAESIQYKGECYCKLEAK